MQNAFQYVGQLPDRELCALGNQWCQGEERLPWKMERLSDSVGCGLVRNVEWGNPIKMAVAAQAGVMEAWSIDGYVSQQPVGAVQ